MSAQLEPMIRALCLRNYVLPLMCSCHLLRSRISLHPVLHLGQDHGVDPATFRERFVPLVVQMHSPYITQLGPERVHSAGAPPRVRSRKRVRQPVVQPTGLAVREAVRKNLERRVPVRDEATPDFVVQARTPVGCASFRRRIVRHCVQHLAQVGRILVKMHHGAVEWSIGFVCIVQR